MKFTSLIAALAALLPVVMADFDIYSVEDVTFPDTGGWTVQDPHQDPICDDLLWPDSDDVSGDKLGIRCTGPGCGQAWPAPITDLEMNFHSGNPDFHWTIRRPHRYAMADVHHFIHGYCEQCFTNDYKCPNGMDQRIGVCKIRCFSPHVTAQDIRNTWDH